MSTPIETLFALNNAERELDMVQFWIDRARVTAARNQSVQLELDRRQTELNTKRAKIEFTRLHIANSN